MLYVLTLYYLTIQFKYLLEILFIPTQVSKNANVSLRNNTRKSPLLKINIMFAMCNGTSFRKKWTLRVCAMAHAWSHNFYIISKLLFSFILLVVCFRYFFSYYRYHNSCFIIFMLILMSFKRIILIIKLPKYLIIVMGNSH